MRDVESDASTNEGAASQKVICKSFGFDIALEEPHRAINAAHVEVERVENGIGFVKLMARYSEIYITSFHLLVSWPCMQLWQVEMW